LEEQVLSLKDVMDLQIGQTLMLSSTPNSPVQLRCGGVPLLTGKMGKVGQQIAIRVEDQLRRLNGG
jgi:flagellar motor switch protein FliM